MTPQNCRKLSARIIKAAEAALAAKNYVSPVDVLVGIGWLDPASLKRWQQGQVAYLERVVQANSVAHFRGHEAVPIMGDC